jgi:sulfur-carrier protein
VGAVTVRLPAALRQFGGDRAAVPVSLDADAPTVADLLAALATECPGVVDRVLDETGAIRRHVNVFVGDTNVRNAGGLAAAVPDGCEVSILAAVSGG